MENLVAVSHTPCVRIRPMYVLANHLTSIDNLAINNQKTENIQMQANVNTKVALINNRKHAQKRTYAETERTDRAWFGRLLRYPARNGMVYYGLTSHSTQYRSFRRRNPARKRSGSILSTPEPCNTGQISINLEAQDRGLPKFLPSPIRRASPDKYCFQRQDRAGSGRTT